MLNPQVAEERLKEFATPDPGKAQKARATALPSALRTAAFALLGLKPDGEPFITLGTTDWAKRQKEREAQEKAQDAACRMIDDATSVEREALFVALFPRLAPLLAWWWTPRGALLYQRGYGRRPFRLPANSDNREIRHERAALLQQLISGSSTYQEMPVEWFAAWVPYLGAYVADSWGKLFAAAIDRGGADGSAVFETLLTSGRGEHETGAMGRHVTRGLLSASRRDGWEWIEKLLLAAQRQEGLRQSILEVADEAHPDAFRGLLRVIRENDLFRFSATVRAADVWFGMNWVAYEKLSVKQANAACETVETFLADPNGRDEVLATSADGQTVYLALWSIAFYDARKALRMALPLLSDPLLTRRYAALHLIILLQLDEARPFIRAAFDDPDLRVAQKAFAASRWHEGADGSDTTAALAEILGQQDAQVSELLETSAPIETPWATFLGSIKQTLEKAVRGLTADAPPVKTLPDDRFEQIERNLPRFPTQEKTLEPVVWEWDTLTADAEKLANVLPNVVGDRPVERLFPYVARMGSYGRSSVAARLGKSSEKNVVAREMLFDLAGDATSYVRDSALKAIKTFTLSDAETERVEKLLTRKAADLRKAALSLLLGRDDTQVLASAERLVAAKDAGQRTAGLDLLGQMVEKKRRADQARAVAARFASERGEKLTEPEKRMLEALTGSEAETVTLNDALGLADLTHLAEEAPPPPPSVWPPLVSLASLEIVQALDALVEAHRETPIEARNYSGDPTEMLLGNVGWRFPSSDAKTPWEKDAERWPLRDMWQQFWDTRPGALRDADGLELYRTVALLNKPDFVKEALLIPNLPDAMREQLTPFYEQRAKLSAKHAQVVSYVIYWLLRREHEANGTLREAPYVLDAAEASLALIASAPASGIPTADGNTRDWRYNDQLLLWASRARLHLERHPDDWTPEQTTRLLKLLVWMEKPQNQSRVSVLDLKEAALAWKYGILGENDLYLRLLGPVPGADRYWQRQFQDLEAVSGRKGSPLFDVAPGLRAVVEKCRARILEVELRRGDTETAASYPALKLRYSGGMGTLVKLVTAFGKDGFARGYSYYGQANRSNVFSRLIRATFPGADETPEQFAALVKTAKISEKRLVETAMYAPQWAKHVEVALGWDGFTDAVWWLHAHTKDNSWSVAADIREAWTAEIADKTPLSAADLTEGAVDVQWFGTVYAMLGEAHWKVLDDAAKFASSAGGHKRAQLFADAMLGRLKREDLLTRIKEKRHQDSLRALGLLPLPEPEAERGADVLQRYQAMQELLRTSKQFGAQRQESEKLAVRIGMENLARTAGYPDPIRLTWAMEASSVADLKDGPVVHTEGAVIVTLAINGLGLPELTVTKKGKALANLPPAVKKVPEVAELVARKTDLTRQVSRMRESLENAMCRGDRFTGKEVADLLEHPILRPLLQNLVFVEADGKEPILGYPVQAGLLEDCDQSQIHVSDETTLRIAHPYDLLHTGRWERWQRNCFLRERIQPFKQVFRELYVLTDAEKTDGTRSQRYAGHQVNPKQALALLGKRGWVGGGDYDYDGDGPRKTFHEDGYTVSVGFMGWTATPADVEGSTINDVRFARKGEWKSVALESVPPRVFSEAMRDLDLVVSVAHVGGVDPEASQSTTEMRAALTREAMALLKITNVRFEKSHAIIDGSLATYNVHLGSGVVHRQPGGYLCIVPVHSQHRGRLFLPFVDDDPRTAEVISKVLLLARDNQIQDPTILEQILSVR